MPYGRPASCSNSYTCAAYDVGTCSSQPNSPTYPTRIARTGAAPIVMSRAVAYRNASFDDVVLADCLQHLARHRAAQVDDRAGRREITDLHTAVVGRIRSDPTHVVRTERRAGDDVPVLLAETASSSDRTRSRRAGCRAVCT